MFKCVPNPSELCKCYNNFKHILSTSGTRISLQEHKVHSLKQISLNQRNELLFPKNRSLKWKAHTHAYTYIFLQLYMNYKYWYKHI